YAAHIELLLHEHINGLLNFNRCKKHISSKIGRFAASRRRAIRGSAFAPFKNDEMQASRTLFLNGSAAAPIPNARSILS
ncbi:hypothetical protein, partial [Treponema sp. UBA7570]|uniref:hypothetical protein n=1 Tax=Treponema sp. UBA7570 TaxID=1947749 RepID=UPI0025D7B151